MYTANIQLKHSSGRTSSNRGAGLLYGILAVQVSSAMLGDQAKGTHCHLTLMG